MTQIEYLKSGCDNRHSKFTFKNGEIAYGLITTFFHNEHDKYYLVRSPQMIEFKKYMDSNDHKKMKERSTLVNLEDLASAELLDSFGELLVKKKSEEEKDKVDWEKRKTTWLNSVDDLYKIINTWLSPFQKEGLLNTVHADDDDVVKRVKELLENYVKPAVEMDGGAIQFKSYNDGIVNLMLQGSCSGCPSSMVTLKAGIEGMMKRMIPEVKEVVAEAE